MSAGPPRWLNALAIAAGVIAGAIFLAVVHGHMAVAPAAAAAGLLFLVVSVTGMVAARLDSRTRGDVQ